MAKESLHSFGIGFDADEERRKAVPQIMKPESPRIVVYQPSFFIRER
jgi:hypothetical protein